MAKTDSIWNWTKEGRSTVSHRGETVNLPIPKWLQGDLENDPEGFLNQIVETVGARTVLAKFLQQAIIDLRSHVRPNDKDDNPVQITQESVTVSASDWIMKEVKVPGSKKEEDPVSLIQKLKEKGYSREEILELIEAS